MNVDHPRPRPPLPSAPAVAHVLFVCNANVCRSPLAHALFASAVWGVPGERWEVASAGVRATAGLPMVEQCLPALRGTAFPARAFRSAVLSRDLVTRADVVVTMTRAELREVLRLVPTALRRTATLTELTRSAHRFTPPRPGTPGPDRLRALLAQTIRDRGPLRPADPAEDDIIDPVGRSSAVLTSVTAAIEDAITTLTRAIHPPASGPDTRA